jgi:thiosulfate/3-mercaptopyruvate sulfurtransferase
MDSGYANSQSLVTTSWLAEHLSQPDLCVVDATYFLPTQGKDGRAEYLARHIPGAVFFDIDEIADESSSLPHMLPSPEKFAATSTDPQVKMTGFSELRLLPALPVLHKSPG